MYDRNDNDAKTADAIAAVHHLVEERDELLDRLDVAHAALELLKRELASIRQEAADTRGELLRLVEMPLTGRLWAYVKDARTLAIAPDIDDNTRGRLMAQVKQPQLTACPVCGAPLYAGRKCRMHVA